MPRTAKIAEPAIDQALPKFCINCGWDFHPQIDVFCGGCSRRRDGMSRPEGCGDECQRCKALVICPRDQHCAHCGARVPT